jgi:hypothetical protein
VEKRSQVAASFQVEPREIFVAMALRPWQVDLPPHTLDGLAQPTAGSVRIGDEEGVH